MIFALTGPTYGHAKVIAGVAVTIVAGALSGCLFGDDDEDCGSQGSLTSAAQLVGCVDPGDNVCVGTQANVRAEIRVDSYDIELPTGQWIHSEGADFDAKPPRITLSLASDSDGANATTSEVTVGRRVTYAGTTFRVTSFCDTGVTWIVPAG